MFQGGSSLCQERFQRAADWPGAHSWKSGEEIAAAMKAAGIEEEAMHECMV